MKVQRKYPLMSQRILPKRFYEHDPAIVATGLLGNVLNRNLKGTLLEGMIVETEAYYGLTDPASRAYRGIKHYNEPMWGEPGTSFIYNVHKYWMFNVVAHEANEIGAVLVRAVEPVRGIALMKAHRPVDKLVELTNGPGKLTTALQIDKTLNGTPLTSCTGEIFVTRNETEFEIGDSPRIGVTRDLERHLRFFIKGNPFVSRQRTRRWNV
jgi:DNA-3-methyladenine glycosylase